MATDSVDAPLYLPYKALVSTVKSMMFSEGEAQQLIEILSEKAGVGTWHTVRKHQTPPTLHRTPHILHTSHSLVHCENPTHSPQNPTHYPVTLKATHYSGAVARQHTTVHRLHCTGPAQSIPQSLSQTHNQLINQFSLKH